jgi:carboxypeptidase C (cathepsin A)
MRKGSAIVVMVLMAVVLRAHGQTTAPATAPTTSPSESGEGKISTTAHQITLDGKPLAYHAIAGDLIAKDETGKAKAQMFFVSYTKDNAGEPANRPITFLFNGGPGAASVWLHLGAAGPMTIDLDDHDIPQGPPYKLIENQATWLNATDLVFVDPVSTGFSRPAAGEKAEQFYGARADIASLADFVRIYLTKYRRWSSPKYLAGESYGTTRVAALAGYLADRYGIATNGIVLISSVLDFQSLLVNAGNDLPYELYLPSYAAVAWYHKKLNSELQADLQKTIDQARKFAVEEYGPALMKGASLSAEKRTEIVKQLAAFSGLPADLVERSNLRIAPELFEKRLLGDGHEIIGRFDGRITGYDADAISNNPGYDPSLSLYFPAYSSTFNEYVRRELNYESELPYEVLTNTQPWKLAPDDGGYLYVVDDLQSAIAQHPHLRVMFVSGYFDLATPFFSADYTIDRMNVGPDLRLNITHEYFTGGHMVYHHRDSAKTLEEDVAKFVSK